MTLNFFVEGIPAPKGSKRHVGRGVLIESSARVKPWRSDVRIAAQEARGDRLPVPKPEPIYLALGFWFPRPKSHYGTGRNASILKPSAPASMTVKPDIDKLERAILDALTGVLWEDDSQVVHLTATKGYAPPGELPGVTITLDIPTTPSEPGGQLR